MECRYNGWKRNGSSHRVGEKKGFYMLSTLSKMER